MLVKIAPTTMPIKGPIKGPFAKPIKSPIPVKGPFVKPFTYAKPVPKGWIPGHGPYIIKRGPGGKIIFKPWPYKPMTYYPPGGLPIVKPITFGQPMCL
tara:strand:+ start:2349 stop:2642 length:294 start_codon:yes stop_codon:yes gene_type:complete